MKIRKAVIPAAGLGTRFLPATKAQPKEMIPIVDKPTIQYILEEAVYSGIEEIIIVIGRDKTAIENHFDKSYELEDTLLKKQKFDILEEVQNISNLVNIYYVRQKEPKGLGHAILCAKSFIGDEPFAVLLGDDIIMSDIPCLQQMLDAFKYSNSSIIAVQEVAKEDVSKYGIIKPKGSAFESPLMMIDSLVEKPCKEEAPSNYAIVGRYVFRPEIFDILENIPIGKNDELQLTDAINQLNKQQIVLAHQFKGKRYDIGEKIGFIKATIDFALQREDTKEEILTYLNKISKTNNEHTIESESE